MQDIHLIKGNSIIIQSSSLNTILAILYMLFQYDLFQVFRSMLQISFQGIYRREFGKKLIKNISENKATFS